jgi:uncharacterized membrane protein YhaH (DUF805 family)
MFKNPFSFTGRIRRTEFGISYIGYFVACLIIIGIGGINHNASYSRDSSPMLVLLLYIPLFWFLLAQGAKRCHDVGHSGWWQIIPFYIFWMLFQDGNPGPNEYGDDPKGRTYEYESYDVLNDQFNAQRRDAAKTEDIIPPSE